MNFEHDWKTVGHLSTGTDDREAAMEDILGIDLGKHEQLHVVWWSPELRVGIHQVLHLILAQSQSHLAVIICESCQRLLTIREDVDDDQGCALALDKHGFHRRQLGGNGLGHPVVYDIAEGQVILGGAFKLDGDHSTPFDAVNLFLETADVGNAGSLGAPWRDVSGSDVDCHTVLSRVDRLRGVVDLEQLLNLIKSGLALLQVDIVQPVSLDGLDLDIGLFVDTTQEFLGL